MLRVLVCSVANQNIGVTQYKAEKCDLLLVELAERPFMFLHALTGGSQANGPGRAGQQLSQPPKRPRTDWGLGLSVAYDAELLEASL